ncbi:MAG: EscU/YscU/HrcU family type III secretion system export apparatus switch protein [Thiothrix sp.]|uniref:EscU/YscU/HrcU family type III secretion system export apparatus switch protein n=1 Tax=Thiothrix sp. TaxID=1032 RepID=UPI0026060E0D|nr:EscU/YscU/HrcU family type III secretion system export apparatus switch protein [Thiothrix sp.]MDD5394825.1 EscU/YscU/HrcU family type III secretion system export apparatus switch protein [Thiothrix sp.]
MSGESSQEKSEKASPRKLDKAREKGQVARSTDIPSTFVLVVAVLYIWASWDWTVEQLKEMFLIVPQLYTLEFHQALLVGIDSILQRGLFAIAIPFSVAMLIAGILGNIVQFGFLFSAESIIPNPDKISFSHGFKRIFSTKQFVTTLISLLKTAIVGGVLLMVLRTGLKELLHAVEQCDVVCQQHVIEHLTRQLILFILPILVLLAVLDYLFQRSQFLKDQRMTKQEVKHELKDSYGDPHVREARHGIRRELAEQDIQQRIRTARLIILDMGMAIALQYEPGVTPLPLIVAIGKGMMARKMVEIAMRQNVPLASNPTLAQDLADQGKIDQYIPESTISRVAQAMRQTAI